MKYRVNFYSEHGARRARMRRSLLRGVTLGLVLGIELGLLGFMVLTGFELRDRTAMLERETAQIESEVLAAGTPDYHGAKRLIEARVARVDWSTLLTELSNEVPGSVVLTEIRGGHGGKPGRLDGLDLEGRLPGREGDLTPVLGLLESMRADSALVGRFPAIDLGTAKGRGNHFEITCRPRRDGGAS